MLVIGFDGVKDFLDKGKQRTADWLSEYFDSVDPDGGYTGRWFEHFSSLSSEWHLDANDVAALSALSVPLDGKTLRSLFARVDAIDGLLMATELPKDATLWGVEEPALAHDSPLSQLYSLLRSTPGVGKVTASKLLACKRPHLVPVRDSVVEAVLGADVEWWAPWRRLVSDPALRDLVEEITPPNVPAGTSILRRLDVVLWRAGKA